MRFLIKSRTAWLENTPHIVRGPKEAYVISTPVRETVHPMWRYQDGFPFKSPTWEEWLQKGYNHEAYDVDLTGTPYVDMSEFSHEYSRTVDYDFWYVNLVTTAELYAFLKKYGAEVVFDTDEPHILLNLKS